MTRFANGTMPHSDVMRTLATSAEIGAVLHSPQFDVVDYSARHANLARALNLDFSHILRTLQFVPACLDAARHSGVRREIGELIAERQAAVRSMSPLILDALLAPLSQPGEYELVTSVLAPFVQKTLRILSGVEAAEQSLEHMTFSDVFSQNIGIIRRRRLNDNLGTVWQWLDEVYANEPESRRGVRLALLVLGADATLGTLAGSLQATLAGAPTRCSDLPFEAVPPCTGVPYVDRQAIVAGQIGGENWERGALARLRLDAFEAAALSEERHRMFGSGAHACLGRAIATHMWRTLMQKLGSLPGRIEFVNLTWQRSDVMRIPEQLVVRILHD